MAMNNFKQLFDQIEVTPGCWLWIGYTRKGYGIKTINGRNVRMHRFLYERMAGPIPPGLELRHMCHNPSCVRPSHMTPGTHAENMNDMVLANRQGRPHYLGDETWAKIKNMLDSGVTAKEVSAHFGIHRNTIYMHKKRNAPYERHH